MLDSAPHIGHAPASGMTPVQVVWDGLLWLILVLAAAAYVVGLIRLWRRAGTGQGIARWQVVSFAVGWSALVVALLSPLDRLSDVLFAAHMTQHELLMLVAAPLLVLARPIVALLWLLPGPRRGQARGWQRAWWGPVWHQLTAPVTALVVHGVVIWAWHIPRFFEAALQNEAIHALQHMMFFWTATLFWWALMHGRYGRLGYGVSVAFVFATAVHSSLLGALLTFAPTSWYPTYRVTAPAVGVDVVADQQLAGLLMWVPSGVVLMLAGLGLFGAWLGEAERRATLRSSTRRSD